MSQQLSADHISAIDRRRRVIDNFDALDTLFRLESVDLDKARLLLFEFIDDPETLIDSVWWQVSEGNAATWPSKILPTIEDPPYGEWFRKGVDFLQMLLDETKKRDLEVFFSYRINGSDNDVIGKIMKIPMKEAHPEWLIHTWDRNINVQHTSEGYNGFWDFSFQGVRDYKLSILREVAEDYDFDGIEIDYARVCPVLPPGRQWENRDSLTDFMRSLRAMLLEVEEKRGRPFLLAARVPENLQGCHFDGLDVETWAQEELVDLFVMGVRSFDVDIGDFRRICAGTNIKLYPCFDDNHSSDGYQHPPLEVFRGVLANWFQQGADGVQTFNWGYTSRYYGPEFFGGKTIDELLSTPKRLSPVAETLSTHLQVYQELGRPEEAHHEDKTFVVQRRGGGHGPTVVPNPEDWRTPRWMYFNTNMLAPLPVELSNDGKADALLTVAVADDLNANSGYIEQVTVRLLLSDPGAKGLPERDRLPQVKIATMGHADRQLYNVPPANRIERTIELRLNNSLLPQATVDQGWLVFPAHPDLFAVGNNLIGLRVSDRPPEAQAEILVEKLEVHIRYKRSERVSQHPAKPTLRTTVT